MGNLKPPADSSFPIATDNGMLIETTSTHEWFQALYLKYNLLTVGPRKSYKAVIAST